MKRISLIAFLAAFLFSLSTSGQDNDSIIVQLAQFVKNVNDFSQHIPQEKVYLHFDNNSYYKDDNIWFKCYVVSSKLHEAKPLSQTLYVDLLDPNGKIISKRVLQIKDGQCNGDFILDNPAFFSGFYEIRAYTKYMLNFGDDAIFSRVFPVFEAPKEKGNYDQKTMLKRTDQYPMKRKKTVKGKDVNVAFFPEGGNLVNGIESKIAFQATNAHGEPLLITGNILEKEGGKTSINFSSNDKGLGYFSYTPASSKIKAIVNFEGKEYNIDLPEAMQEGYTMSVDNLSDTDNINIKIHKSETAYPNVLGVAALCRGNIHSFNIINFKNDNEVSLSISKKDIPAGVCQILLFNNSGEPLCDRLIFIDQQEYLNISSNHAKDSFNPYELINLDFSVTDNNYNPVNTSFSLSVKDAADDNILYSNNIQTNLLLASDIKGYIHNPSYYFESNDTEHKQDLDLLLMVQGWRRYSWGKMAGLEYFAIKHAPEQGVEIRGVVRSPNRKKIKPNIDVTLALTQTDENEKKRSEYLIGQTDSLGEFRLVSFLNGTWDMLIGVSSKGKKKNEDIILDRLFRPKAKSYTLPELRIDFMEQKETKKNNRTEDNNMVSIEDSLYFMEDSLQLGIDQKTHSLKEVTIIADAKKHEYLEKMVTYYDVSTEVNDLIDDGNYVDGNIYNFLRDINPFIVRQLGKSKDSNNTPKDSNNAPKDSSSTPEDYNHEPEGFYYTYKGKPLIIVNGKDFSQYNISTSAASNVLKPRSYGDFLGLEFKISSIDWADITKLSAVKSIYISEDPNLLAQAFPGANIHDVQRTYGGILFLEMHPKGNIPNEARGMRNLKMEGYSLQKEFYSPDYSILPREADYRRTLYWNPNVTTDNEGKARVQFYNNSTCKKINISAETITADGITGVYKEE